MQKSDDNVSCPHENRIRISDLLFVSTLLLVTEITRSALSLRITVLVELRLCLLICSTERKTPCQNVQVRNLYGIWKIWFHSIHQILHSIPYLGHSIFHTDIFFPFHIPFHTIACPGRTVWRTINKLTGISGCSFPQCPVSANYIATQLVKNGAQRTVDRESTRMVNKELST